MRLPPAHVGDANIESNTSTNHPQQEFDYVAQLTALQAQVAALTALLQNRNAAISQPPQETPPTTAPLLVLVSLAPSSALHFNSLASDPNPHWGQPSWCPRPTLAETPVLSLEQRLEDMMGRKIAKAMSKKSSRQQTMVLEEDPFSLEVMVVPCHEILNNQRWRNTTDPLILVNYLRAFVYLMRLRATPDVIMYKNFPPTLRRKARDWVVTLSPKINSYI
ncbi:Uncharacterized protein Adt_39792 [Abeliophyllum distichum]|uniref:Uncharacterized protein n=1 Tax=Abeliophyllum distichum TaxID=126358 RepID=A0ABD1QAC5_9LAMI